MGFVYLVGSERFGWYKIGNAKDATVRLEQLGILLPFKLEVFAIWKSENHHLLEKQAHRIFDSFRLNGEWFCFDAIEREQVIRRISAWECQLVFPSGILKTMPIRSSNVKRNITRELGGDNKSARHIAKKMALERIIQEKGFDRKNKDHIAQAWKIVLDELRSEKLALKQAS